MVVWEDRGVLKPPKPPIVHATGKGGHVEIMQLGSEGDGKLQLFAMHCACMR